MTQFTSSFDAAAGLGLPPGSIEIAFWVEPGMLAGEAAFVRHLIMGLKAEGQKITFIAPQGLSLAELPVLGSRVLTYRWNRWERLPLLQKLRLNTLARQLNDAPPDVLIAWGSSDATSSAALAVLSQIVPALPVVLWCWDASELFTPLARLPSVRHIVASSTAIASRVPEGFTVSGNASPGGGGGGGEGSPSPSSTPASTATTPSPASTSMARCRASSRSTRSRTAPRMKHF